MAKRELEDSIVMAGSVAAKLIYYALHKVKTEEEIEKMTDELAYGSEQLREVILNIEKALKGYSFVLRKQKGQAFKAVSKLKVMKQNNPHLSYKIQEIIAIILPEQKIGNGEEID